MRAQTDFSDTLAWDKIGVSSFSTGYAAVREILKQPAYCNEINTMLLADTVYASVCRRLLFVGTTGPA